MSERYIGPDTDTLKSGDYASSDQVDYNSGNFISENDHCGKIPNGNGQRHTNSFGEPYDSIWDTGYMPQNYDYHNDDEW